jgi:hypothetical protein
MHQVASGGRALAGSTSHRPRAVLASEALASCPVHRRILRRPKRGLQSCRRRFLRRNRASSRTYSTPVAANQLPTPAPPETNTIGATHGCGSMTVSEMSASPPGLAASSPVRTLASIGAPESSTLWQLTTAWNVAAGLVPCKLPGTGSAGASTSPRTLTVSCPLERSSPVADEMIHGNPPPGISRIGFADPTYGPETAAIVSNPSATAAGCWANDCGADSADTASTAENNPTNDLFIASVHNRACSKRMYPQRFMRENPHPHFRLEDKKSGVTPMTQAQRCLQACFRENL